MLCACVKVGRGGVQEGGQLFYFCHDTHLYFLQELLVNKQIYLDGSKIEESGFQYEYPLVGSPEDAACFAFQLYFVTCCWG